MASEKTIGRLTLYRRILNECIQEGTESIHSHTLAAKAGASSAQVRRDLMESGYVGHSRRGYDVMGLIESLREFLDAPEGQGVALVGVGNLGRAILAYFVGRRPSLAIRAAFDIDPQKVGRVVHGCRCHPMETIEDVIAEEGITTAVLAVPVDSAQEAAERLVRGGVRGILNFAPIPLTLPETVHVENIDMSMALEKVAYFSRDDQQTT